MKCTFTKGDGDDAMVASVTMEPDGVTVAEKRANARTLGKPIRIPTKLCQEGSTQTEFTARCMQLKAQGYILQDEDKDSILAAAEAHGRDDQLHFVVIEPDRLPEAIEILIAAGLEPGRKLRAKWLFRIKEPNAPAALLLANKGLARIYDQKLDHRDPIAPMAVVEAAQTLGPAVCATLEEAGFVDPSVITSNKNCLEAILF